MKRKRGKRGTCDDVTLPWRRATGRPQSCCRRSVRRGIAVAKSVAIAITNPPSSTSAVIGEEPPTTAGCARGRRRNCCRWIHRARRCRCQIRPRTLLLSLGSAHEHHCGDRRRATKCRWMHLREPPPLPSHETLPPSLLHPLTLKLKEEVTSGVDKLQRN